MEKKQFFLALRAMWVTLCIFLFIGALFVAMNNSQKAIHDQAFALSAEQEGVVLHTPTQSWLIPLSLSPETNPIQQTQNLFTQPPEPFTGWLFPPPSALPNRIPLCTH